MLNDNFLWTGSISDKSSTLCHWWGHCNYLDINKENKVVLHSVWVTFTWSGSGKQKRVTNIVSSAEKMTETSAEHFSGEW